MKIQNISIILILTTALTTGSSNQITHNPQPSNKGTITTENYHTHPHQSSDFAANFGR